MQSGHSSKGPGKASEGEETNKDADLIVQLLWQVGLHLFTYS